MSHSFFPKITIGKPALVLAPMEGVVDAPMRALMTERSGFSFCVSEFVRVVRDGLPPKAFLSHVPELRSGGLTPSGTPVQIQILGGHEESMAKSAQTAVRLGALAIDLNFGCPAPLVNKNDGGARILQYPNRIQSLVRAVRDAVPPDVAVSAKLRLGWEKKEDIFQTWEQAVLGGASWITIHARTKTQGYRPPVDWKLIGKVKKQSPVPVVANGDIWTKDDFLRCQEDSECEHYMLGRGALGDPSLVQVIATELGIPVENHKESYPFVRNTKQWEPLLKRFCQLSEPYQRSPQYSVRRLKQWLRMADSGRGLASFEELKRCQSLSDLFSVLSRQNGI